MPRVPAATPRPGVIAAPIRREPVAPVFLQMAAAVQYEKEKANVSPTSS